MLDKTPEARPGSLEVALDASITWRYLAPAGTTLDQCMRPDYWRNVVRELGQQRVLGRHSWNRIEIICEDGTWEAELRVLAVSNGLVQTRVIREWHVPSKGGRKPAVPEGYKVEHVPHNGWRALDPNGQIVAASLSIEDEAVRAAAGHARKAKGD